MAYLMHASRPSADGVVWAGHSNPRHVRNTLAPKFMYSYGRRTLSNEDIRGDDLTRANILAHNMGLDGFVPHVFTVTNNVFHKIIFFHQLEAAKATIEQLPASIVVIDTAGNDLTLIKTHSPQETLELASRVFEFLRSLDSKFKLIIFNAVISCRTGNLKGVPPLTYFRNAEDFNHYLQTMMEAEGGRIYNFNRLHYLRASNPEDDIAKRTQVQTGLVLKDKIHPHTENYVQKVRMAILGNSFSMLSGLKTRRKRRPGSRGKRNELQKLQ